MNRHVAFVLLGIAVATLVSYYGVNLLMTADPSLSNAPLPANTSRPTQTATAEDVERSTRLKKFLTDPDALDLLSAASSDAYGYHTIEGEVKNISSNKLENVMVVVSWYTKDRTLITTDTAMIEYQPVMPGQTSPYKTMSRSNPAMHHFTVAFKQMFGGTLHTKDSRQQ